MSILTTIPEKALDKFHKKMIFCICESVEESCLAGEDISVLDIGIGTLYIKHDVQSQIKYHFEPSDMLQKAITQTVVNKQNLLEISLNDALAKRFMDVYKDLC